MREAEWCGARNGGRVSREAPAGSAPHSECTAVSSSDSSSDRSGNRPGMRSASVVLPDPFGPGEHQVVATGRGDLDGVAGVGHAHHVGHVEVLQPLLPSPGEQRRARHRLHLRRLGNLVASFSSAIIWPSDRIPNTAMPGTIAASAVCGSGT